MQRKLRELRKCRIDQIRIAGGQFLALELHGHSLAEDFILDLKRAPECRNTLRQEVDAQLRQESSLATARSSRHHRQLAFAQSFQRAVEESEVLRAHTLHHFKVHEAVADLFAQICHGGDILRVEEA
jgi:hypothetical protein